jgi:TnpA family transposase
VPTLLTDPRLRRWGRRGLLKGEQLDALARHVPDGKRGHVDAWDFQQQIGTASCLVLILAAIVCWQIPEIDRVLHTRDLREASFDPALLMYISPIGWDNVLLYGEYWLDRTRVRRPHDVP